MKPIIKSSLFLLLLLNLSNSYGQMLHGIYKGSFPIAMNKLKQERIIYIFPELQNKIIGVIVTEGTNQKTEFVGTVNESPNKIQINIQYTNIIEGNSKHGNRDEQDNVLTFTILKTGNKYAYSNKISDKQYSIKRVEIADNVIESALSNESTSFGNAIKIFESKGGIVDYLRMPNGYPIMAYCIRMGLDEHTEILLSSKAQFPVDYLKDYDKMARRNQAVEYARAIKISRNAYLTNYTKLSSNEFVNWDFLQTFRRSIATEYKNFLFEDELSNSETLLDKKERIAANPKLKELVSNLINNPYPDYILREVANFKSNYKQLLDYSTSEVKIQITKELDFKTEEILWEKCGKELLAIENHSYNLSSLEILNIRISTFFKEYDKFKHLEPLKSSVRQIQNFKLSLIQKHSKQIDSLLAVATKDELKKLKLNLIEYTDSQNEIVKKLEGDLNDRINAHKKREEQILLAEKVEQKRKSEFEEQERARIRGVETDQIIQGIKGFYLDQKNIKAKSVGLGYAYMEPTYVFSFKPKEVQKKGGDPVNNFIIGMQKMTADEIPVVEVNYSYSHMVQSIELANIFNGTFQKISNPELIEYFFVDFVLSHEQYGLLSKNYKTEKFEKTTKENIPSWSVRYNPEANWDSDVNQEFVTSRYSINIDNKYYEQYRKLINYQNEDSYGKYSLIRLIRFFLFSEAKTLSNINQLGENLLRYLTGKPSLQDSKVRNTLRIGQDDTLGTLPERNLFYSCLEFSESPFSVSEETFDRCGCIEKSTQGDDYSKMTINYSEYFRSNSKLITDTFCK